MEKIQEEFTDLSRLAIATGDISGSKYGRYVSSKFDVPLIIVDKQRDTKSGETKAIKVYTQGEVSRHIDTVIFVDDIMSTFGTMKKAADALSDQYPWITEYYAAATHPDFGKETLSNIVKSKFKEIWITDTVPIKDSFLFDLNQHKKKVVVISVAKLLATVIDNVHDGKPISALWK